LENKKERKDLELNFSILVNTTDSFEDCWHPLFKLFKQYWPEYNGKIYLNTETKEYHYSGLNIISIQNGLTGKPWSQCLKHALEFIDEEHILYMQEDYFLHSSVNNLLVKEFLDKFKTNNLDCLHLTDQCTSGPFNKNTCIENVWEIEKRANYRLSTQAAFWRKDSLIKLIRNWESAWQFEHYGKKRSNYLLNKVMCVNQNKFKKDKNEVLPYVFTGIIKGKWNKEVVELFNNSNIQIDFEKRGFYYPKQKTLKQKILSRLNLKQQFNEIISIVDIQLLKFKTVVNRSYKK